MSNSASQLGGFFAGVGNALITGLAKSMWDRLSQNKRILFSDRPDSIENEVQQAFGRGEITSEADVLALITAYSTAKGSVPLAPGGKPTVASASQATAGGSQPKAQPPPAPPPPPPSPPKPPGFDYAKTTKTYQDTLGDVNRQRRNLYQYDAGMAPASEVRGNFAYGRSELESKARAGGGDDKEVQRVLAAFDKLAKSAEILAERNDRLGTKEAERATKDAGREADRADAEDKRQADEMMADRKKWRAEVEAQKEKAENERKASWYRATGKTGATDTLFGTDRLEKDPRGYMMGMASLMMSGPVMSKMAGLLSGTMGGAARGYQIGGVAGAAVGAAAGASSDIFNLGGNANPQAQATFDQSWELFKARAGSATGADKWMNLASARLQQMGDTVAGGREGGRGFSGEAAAYAGKTNGWLSAIAGPGGTMASGFASAGIGRLFGLKAPGETAPGMEAPPILAGVGGAMGSSMSYEAYAQSFGQSSINGSPIDQARIAEQLKNLTGLLERLTDNSEGLKNITQPFG